MLQLSGVNPPWLQLSTAAGKSMQSGLSAHQQTRPSSGSVGSAQQASQARSSSGPAVHSGLHQHSVQSHAQVHAAPPKHAQGVQQQQQQDTAKQRVAALSFLTSLRLSLSDTVLGWFQDELGEFWQNVLLIKPPWNDLQFVQVMNHHWNSTLKVCAAHRSSCWRVAREHDFRHRVMHLMMAGGLHNGCQPLHSRGGCCTPGLHCANAGVHAASQ
jgi:hypothetical protein